MIGSKPKINLVLLTAILVMAFGLPVCLHGQEASGQAEATTGPREEIRPLPPLPLDHLEKAVSDQLQERRAQFDAIINNPATDPVQQADAHGDLGMMYQAYELFEAAEICYRNALTLDPENYHWNYSLAYLLQRNGDFDEAVIHYQKALDAHQDPQQEYLVNIRLGECLLGSNKAGQARQAFERAHQLSPTDPVALARLGETAFKEKKYEDAVEYLENALKQQPEADKLHYTLAMAYRALRKMKEARKHLALRGKVGLQPPDPLLKALNDFVAGSRIHVLNARMAFGAERYEDAAELFQKAVDAQPEDASCRVNLGVTLSKLGKHDEAIKQLEKALELQPDNFSAHFNIGSLLLFEGQHEKAIEHLQFVVDKDPKDATANLLLANALMKSRRLVEAGRYYNRALEIDSRLTDAWLELGYVLDMLNQPGEAVALLEKAHSEMPSDGPIAQALARELAMSSDYGYRDGKRALALALAVYRSRKDYETAKTLAMAYAELNLCDKAVFWMKKSIQMATKAGMNIEIIRTLFRNLEHFSGIRPCRIP